MEGRGGRGKERLIMEAWMDIRMSRGMSSQGLFRFYTKDRIKGFSEKDTIKGFSEKDRIKGFSERQVKTERELTPLIS